MRPPTLCACGRRQIGWSKVQELRRYIKLFRDSGKYTVCYMKVRPLLLVLLQCRDGLSHCAATGCCCAVQHVQHCMRVRALVMRYVRALYCIRAALGHAARPAGSSETVH